MHVSAIVLAAGKGTRFSRPNSFTVRGGTPTHINKIIESGKSNVSKPLVKINSKPIIVFCLKTLSKHPYIKDIVVVVNSKNKEDIVRKISQYRIGKIKGIVLGGKRRQDSVRSGLKVIDNSTKLVLIHDGTRPFIDKQTVTSVIKEAQKIGAAIVGVPVRATIKKVKSKKLKVKSKFIVAETINRNNLWEIQTPQVFKKELVLKAYEKFGNTNVTDDASLVERSGHRVGVVMGSYFNIKVTTPEDLMIAKAILEAQNLKRKA